MRNGKGPLCRFLASLAAFRRFLTTVELSAMSSADIVPDLGSSRRFSTGAVGVPEARRCGPKPHGMDV
jgi:hypothetical protein